MSCPNYKIVFNDETNYVAQDISEEPVVRVIPAKGEQGETGPKGEDGKNFEPTIVSELPETGEENKLYLTPKNYTRSTATGNPITATITAQAGQLESFQLDGDTYQQTYTGKNLFDKSAVTIDGSRVATATGATYTNSTTVDYSVSPYITIEGGANYSITKTARTYVAWYNNGTYISGIGYTQGENLVAPENANQIRFDFLTAEENIVMLEKSSEPTTPYEPYVGGTASPNPDYPEPIQTVTGEQTVEIIGKNLFDGITTNQLILSDGTITSNGNWNLGGYIKVSPNTTYTVSFKLGSGGSHSVLVSEFDSNKDFIIRSGSKSTVPFTFTTSSTTEYIRLNYNNTNNDTDFQVELGSTATTYTPYSKQTLPISLGTIELCKLGTYQDYIWKDGDDWKVHKATGKYIFDGSETPTVNTSSTNTTRCLMNNLLPSGLPAKPEESGSGASNYFAYRLNWSLDEQGIYVNSRAVVFRGNKTTIGTTLAEVQTWLTTNKPSLYYTLNTPTDTTITDTALIAQLEAIRTASLENGTNTITNTATGTNLAGDMEIGYYGFNPTNRYDKFIWLDINNEYEQLNNPDTASSTLNSTRNLNLTNIQSDSNENNNDEEQENEILDDTEEEER